MSLEVAQKVIYITTQQLAGFMSAKERWSVQNNSHLKNASKQLNNLTKKGVLEKFSHFYRLKGARGNGDPHALGVTDHILSILLKYPEALIYREPTLPFGRKPDAAVLIKKKSYQFFFLEYEDKNALDYIEGKIADYQHNEKEVCLWFENNFGIKSPSFCFHLLFITRKQIPEREGVIVRRNYA